METNGIQISLSTMKFLVERTRSAKSEGIEMLVSGGLIVRSQRVLLLLRSPTAFFPNCWDIPGGKVGPDESFLEGFSREIFEETGMQLTGVNDFVSCFDFIDGQQRRTRQFNFFIATSSSEVRIDKKEHSSYGWFSERDLPVISPRTSGETLGVLRSAFQLVKRSL